MVNKIWLKSYPVDMPAEVDADLFRGTNDPPIVCELRSVRRIQLVFHQDQQARTQEFLLRWSPDGGQSCREIVRQQYNFSPAGVTRGLKITRSTSPA